MRRKIVAVVGMPGAGKSIISEALEKLGLNRIRFGDITDEHLKRQGLARTEKNERRIREGLRKTYGMAAYAVLNVPRMEEALRKGHIVVDGLYSWDEYLVLRDRFGSRLHVVAVYAPPPTRYGRLAHRKERPLSEKDAVGRDVSEIENIGKAGPIAMADWTIVNEEKGIRALEKEVRKIWKRISR